MKTGLHNRLDNDWLKYKIDLWVDFDENDNVVPKVKHLVLVKEANGQRVAPRDFPSVEDVMRAFLEKPHQTITRDKV